MNVIDIIKKINPKLKVKQSKKGFMNWWMHKVGAAAICLFDSIHFRDDMPINELTLFHEGVHQLQLKEIGKFRYIVQYFALLPVFKTKRYEFEAYANYIEYYVLCLLKKRAGQKKPDPIMRVQFIDSQLARLAWGFMPYFYANLQYKINNRKWAEKEATELRKIEAKVWDNSVKTEYEQDIHDYYMGEK